MNKQENKTEIKNLLSFNYNINSYPAKLKNKTGSNICWWNAFINLFTSTRDKTIINKFIEFVNKHDNEHNYINDNKNNMQCWYCNIFDIIIKITTSNNLEEIDFYEYLFDTPNTIIDPKNANKTIDHPFNVFFANQQEDSFVGCNKWFEIIHIKVPYVYDLFGITTISEITCL